ncbi:uncharacterized protein LOC143280919 [Babylonia areolata]|uniref:uncharacterized protein LOC143280919 n=1 Tax=Babylonia areolata TaxID=304850 RepID=UPI003FCFCEAF
MNPFRKTVGFYEVMATSYTTGNSETSYTSTKQMETYPSKPARTAHGISSSGKSSPKGVSVNFDPKDKTNHAEKREKYLTAKYGAHQMLLIKKRLAVEMWVFEELGRLYCTEDDDHDCNLELEEVLNLDTDEERREYALEQLASAKESQEEVHKFVDELLKKAKTL